MTRAAAALALAVLAAAAPPASAAPAAPTPPAPAAEPAPDPAAVDAGDANLESIDPRQGMALTLALGGGITVGIGMDNATARGGSYTARLARAANRRASVALEIVGAALFFGVSGQLYRTDAINLLLSGQYYLNQGLWIRTGVGAGRYAGDELRQEMNGMAFILRERFRYAGPAGSVGAGIDVVRFRRVRLSVELSATALLNRDGILASSGLLFGLTID